MLAVLPSTLTFNSVSLLYFRVFTRGTGYPCQLFVWPFISSTKLLSRFTQSSLNFCFALLSKVTSIFIILYRNNMPVWNELNPHNINSRPTCQPATVPFAGIRTRTPAPRHRLACPLSMTPQSKIHQRRSVYLCRSFGLGRTPHRNVSLSARQRPLFRAFCRPSSHLCTPVRP